MFWSFFVGYNFREDASDFSINPRIGCYKSKTDDFKPSYDSFGIGTREGGDEDGLFLGLGFNYHISDAAAITFGHDLYDMEEDTASYTHIGLRYYLR